MLYCTDCEKLKKEKEDLFAILKETLAVYSSLVRTITELIVIFRKDLK